MGCTGHSLGGALGSITCLDLKVSPTFRALQIGKVNVISFGEPRWCNREVVQYYNNVMDSHWRVTNRYDIAMTVPPRSFGYAHVGTQIWYNFEYWWWDINKLAWKQCDGSGEDYDCYGSTVWPSRTPQFSHHLDYLEVPFRNQCGSGSSSAVAAIGNELLEYEQMNAAFNGEYANRMSFAPDFVLTGLILFAPSCLMNIIFCGGFVTSFACKRSKAKAASKAGWNKVKFVEESGIEEEVDALNL